MTKTFYTEVKKCREVKIMEYSSTVITIKNLLEFHFEPYFQDFIQRSNDILTIPAYQREYKWEDAKVKTLVDNILQQSKLLGVINLEILPQHSFSIIDGQQRLTTLMLLFAQLYNACADEGETETQEEIKSIISKKCDGIDQIKLENKSVGYYLKFVQDESEKNRISLVIDPECDIYKQTKAFQRVWDIIDTKIKDHRRQTPNVTLDQYKQRLLDCKVLVFAQKNTEGSQQGSSEEIYIDINEKAQKLDPEDIFKGRCFAMCKSAEQQHRVKELWCAIKQSYFSEGELFKRADLGSVLHYYLLTQEALHAERKDIKKDLTIDGEHIIPKRYNTPTKTISLLTSINDYQKHLLTFFNELDQQHCEFSLVMRNNRQDIGNHTEELNEMRQILSDLMVCSQNLFKLPLFFLIDAESKKQPEEKLTYKQFSQFIYLYYVYMLFFSRLNVSKKREDLPFNLIKKISTNEDFLIQFIREIQSYATDSVELESKNIRDEHTRKHLYQILDSFKISSASVQTDANLSITFKLFPASYNLEHLIVNQSHKIHWQASCTNENGNETPVVYDFKKEDFVDCPTWAQAHKCWANFIWIDKDFNRDRLGNLDILQKIDLLRGSCDPTQTPSPGTYAKKHFHIEAICQHIMSTDGFSKLLSAHQRNESKENVQLLYKNFLDHYFSDERLDDLRIKMNTKLIETLHTLYEAIPVQ